MANKNNTQGPEFHRAAPNLFLPNWALDKLLLLPTEEMAAIVRAAINYFQKGVVPDFGEFPTPWIADLLFADIRKAIDENEIKYRKRTEASSKGGKNTQARNKAAREHQAIGGKTQPAEAPTYNNILNFAESKGYSRKAGEEFWDYNNCVLNIGHTPEGELYLKSDRNGKPLYNWQSALIGFVEKEYDRAEWEIQHGIDTKTHKPKRTEAQS